LRDDPSVSATVGQFLVFGNHCFVSFFHKSPSLERQIFTFLLFGMSITLESTRRNLCCLDQALVYQRKQELKYSRTNYMRQLHIDKAKYGVIFDKIQKQQNKRNLFGGFDLENF
jgi:hypothetical protein